MHTIDALVVWIGVGPCQASREKGNNPPGTGWLAHTNMEGRYIEILKEALNTLELDYLLVLLRAVGPMNVSERGND